jgi:PrcB C-terminal
MLYGRGQRYRDLMVELAFRTIAGRWLLPAEHLQQGLHIVRDADGWNRLWTGSALRQPSEPRVLAVNWRTEMCVVAALGARPTGGYSVLIDMIEVVADHVTVAVWEIRPGPNCVTTRGITHPFHAVAVCAQVGEANLVKRIAYEDCEADELLAGPTTAT